MCCAVLESMLTTYADTDLVDSAVRAARVKAEASAPSIRGELRSADTAIQKAEEALARYFDAFENGTLMGSTFAARVEAIEEKLAGLRTRREQLAETIDADAPTPADLSDAENAIREAIASGTAGQRKSLLQTLVAEIRVESRDAIFPTYRLPAGPVRVMSGVVGRGGLEPPTSAVSRAERCAWFVENGA
jgi:site-specific DNA recombinase